MALINLHRLNYQANFFLYFYFQYDIICLFTNRKGLRRNLSRVPPQALCATPLTRSLHMSSVTQAPATRERLNELVAELFGDSPTTGPQAPAHLSTAGQCWQQCRHPGRRAPCGRTRRAPPRDGAGRPPGRQPGGPAAAELRPPRARRPPGARQARAQSP